MYNVVRLYIIFHMIDPSILRQNPEIIKKLISLGRADSTKVDLDKWLQLDKKRSDLIYEIEKFRSERNQINTNIVSRPSQEIVDQMNKLKIKIQTLEKELDKVVYEWKEILDWIPNIPFEEVPYGTGSEDNVEIKAWDPENGYFTQDKLGKNNHSANYFAKRSYNTSKDFNPRPHWEIGEKLKLFDLESGAKVSGSRFHYITGDGVLLIYGCFDLLWKKLLQEGFSPMIVPLLVKEDALYGSSHFPGDADQVYKLESKNVEDNNALYLVGSSEPSNFAFFKDRVLNLTNPIKIMARTPCFRSEVGSWGRDVRGIKRTHQFDKLEMNMIIEADDNKAREAHEYLLSLNEWLLQQLKIPYRVINMCTGDLGYYAAAKKYDIEFWTPSQNTFTELMSDSITTDYQARRLNIKYKDKDGTLRYAYTLNDTGVTNRILIAIIEHYQRSDGSLLVPDILEDYVGKKVIS